MTRREQLVWETERRQWLRQTINQALSGTSCCTLRSAKNGDFFVGQQRGGAKRQGGDDLLKRELDARYATIVGSFGDL